MGGKGSGNWNRNKYSQSEPGANSKAVMNALIGLKKPRVDVKDPQAIAERMEEYLNYCIENDVAPSVAGCANWLGVHIDTVSAWYSGRRGSPEHQRTAANFYGVLQDIWAQKMDNGNINPVSGIFMGKAFYGYKDTQEIVVSNNNNQERSIADLIAESKRLPGAETLSLPQSENTQNTIDADFRVVDKPEEVPTAEQTPQNTPRESQTESPAPPQIDKPMEDDPAYERASKRWANPVWVGLPKELRPQAKREYNRKRYHANREKRLAQVKEYQAKKKAEKLAEKQQAAEQVKPDTDNNETTE